MDDQQGSASRQREGGCCSSPQPLGKRVTAHSGGPCFREDKVQNGQPQPWAQVSGLMGILQESVVVLLWSLDSEVSTEELRKYL